MTHDDDVIAERLDPTPDDERAFTEYTKALTVRFGRRFILFLAAMVVVWWPVDALLADDRGYHPVEFAVFRLAGLGAFAIAWLLLGRAWVRARLLVMAPVTHAGVLFILGVAIGRMGGASLPWLALGNVAILPSAMVPLPLRARIAATAASALALAIGCFGPFPENREGPFWAAHLSFLGFTTALVIWMGHLAYMIVRTSYFRNAELARARADLAAVNGSLEAQVALRTAEIGRLASHLETIIETERARISLELHDELGQDLTALRYTLSLAARRVSSDPEITRALLLDLQSVVDRASTTLRTLVGELRPRILEHGLFAAARWLCPHVERRSDIPCRLTVSGDDAAVPAELTAAAFRILQEATTNALKHAAPSVLEVSLAVGGTTLDVHVRDDGRGFDATNAPTGVGLIGMRERASSVGGELHVQATPGAGCRVHAHFDWSRGAA